MEICERHLAQGRAWAFALLMYDFTNRAVRSIIEHDPYWNELDELTGTDLTVFSVHASHCEVTPKVDPLIVGLPG